MTRTFGVAVVFLLFFFFFYFVFRGALQRLGMASLMSGAPSSPTPDLLASLSLNLCLYVFLLILCSNHGSPQPLQCCLTSEP